MSKRRLLELVKGKFVEGWDDPRMPTIVGLRRRGYTPEAIRSFCARIGVTKTNSLTEYAVLEQEIREHLNKVATRVMAVLDPIKVVIENYPEAKSELREFVNNPEDPAAGSREVPFGREIFIEREDFMEIPPKGYFRLVPGGEVRLRYAYFLKCNEVVKNPTTGEIVELRCSYDPTTAGGKAPDGRKVKGTIHWVNAATAVDAAVRLYESLLSDDDGKAKVDGRDWKQDLNPKSLVTINGAKLEPVLAQAILADRFQFERLGYFCLDKSSQPEKLVFNRTVTLKDSWAREQKK